MCQEKLDNMEDALKDYSKAVEIKPTEGAAWSNMGQIYKEREDWAKVRPAAELFHTILFVGTLFC